MAEKENKKGHECKRIGCVGRDKTVLPPAISIQQMNLTLQQKIMTGTVTLECFLEEMNRYLVGESDENSYGQHHNPHITFRFFPNKEQKNEVEWYPGVFISRKAHHRIHERSMISVDEEK